MLVHLFKVSSALWVFEVMALIYFSKLSYHLIWCEIMDDLLPINSDFGYFKEQLFAAGASKPLAESADGG